MGKNNNRHPTGGQQWQREIDFGAINEENRTVEIAFASEYPYERWFGIEILKCDHESVDLKRLQEIGVLLFNHDMNRVIGKILDARVDADQICRATVQFDDDDESEVIYKKVVNGTLKTISVGYFVHRWEIVEENAVSADGSISGPAEIATSWEPYEISVVSVPADPTVGIGRSIKKVEGKRMETSIAKKMRKLSRRFSRYLKWKDEDNLRSLAQEMESIKDEVKTELGGATPEEIAAVQSEVETVIDELETIAEDAEENAALADEVLQAAEDVLDAIDNTSDEGDGGDGSDEGNRDAKDDEEDDDKRKAKGNRPIRRKPSELRESLKIIKKYGLDPELAASRSIEQIRKIALEKKSEGGKPVADGRVQVGNSQEDKFIRAAKAALLLRAGKEVSQEEMELSSNLRGMSILEIGREHLRLVENKTVVSKEELVRALFANGSSTGFSQVLANVAQNELMRGYQIAPTTYQFITRKGTLKDYKPAKRSRLTNFGTLPQVPEGAEYEQAKLADVGADITLGKYGQTFAITRETLINDDLGAFTEIPYKMGLAARFTIEYAVYDLLLNGKAPDGTPLFTMNHGNLISPGSAITVESLGALIAKMRRQTDMNSAEGAKGYPIIIEPKYLMVPPELETLALQLVASTVDPDKHNDTINPFNRKLEVIQSPFFTDPKAWYMLANPQVSDTIEVAYLDGNEAPFMEEEEISKNDTRTYKVRLEFGASILDHKAMSKNVGQ